jgi:hypothetical protein
MHLAAAGLAGGKNDGVAEPLEDADDGLAGLGKEGVVVAGDEQRNLQAASAGAPWVGNARLLQFLQFNREYISLSHFRSGRMGRLVEG